MNPDGVPAELIAQLVRRGFIVSFMLEENMVVALATSGGKTTTTSHRNTVYEAVFELNELMEKT